MGTCYSHLSPDERIRIERLHCEQGLSVRETAGLVGRDRATVSRELRRGLWFASNENESYRPYRPRRLKTGPWTSMPFCSALAAQRRADRKRHEPRRPRRMDSDRLVFSQVGVSVFVRYFFRFWAWVCRPGVFYWFWGLPNMSAWLMRWLCPVNSMSRPWWTMRSMIEAASLSSAKIVPHLLNSMFVVKMMLLLS